MNLDVTGLFYETKIHYDKAVTIKIWEQINFVQIYKVYQEYIPHNKYLQITIPPVCYQLVFKSYIIDVNVNVSNGQEITRFLQIIGCLFIRDNRNSIFACCTAAKRMSGM